MLTTSVTKLLHILSIVTSGGHTHTCIILHESEAPAAIHQESHEEIPRGDRAH